MARIIWAPAALADLDSIAAWISRDSRDEAALFISRMIEAVDRLQLFPTSGRIIPEINDPACRQVVYGDYRVMYRIKGNEIWITGVVHGARDWKPGSK